MIRSPHTRNREAYLYWSAVTFMRFNVRHGVPFDRRRTVEEFEVMAEATDWPLLQQRYDEARAAVLQLSLAYQA